MKTLLLLLVVAVARAAAGEYSLSDTFISLLQNEESTWKVTYFGYFSLR